MSFTRPEILERISKSDIIAVFVVDRVEDAVPLANALVDGGVKVMELTLRTDAAVDALSEIKEKVSEMLTCIGTVLNVEQVKQIAEAGATLYVAPGNP